MNAEEPGEVKETTVFIGYTTIDSKDGAENLAKDLVDRGLAGCVQVEGPLLSFYKWKGRLEQSTEFRLVIKFLGARADALEAHLLNAHPYAVPQWLAVPAHFVGEKYLSWLQEPPTH